MYSIESVLKQFYSKLYYSYNNNNIGINNHFYRVNNLLQFLVNFQNLI